MAKPTQEQLRKINRFTESPLNEDEVYVFNNLMIDDQPTAYYSIIHENLLRKFTQDAADGIPLILVHNTRRLAVGRSFDAYLREDLVDGDLVKTVYGQFYIPYGLKTDSGIMTDDLIKGIETGVHRATSIGFSAEEWKCSICGNDIRNYLACPHFPGRKYVVTKDGNDEIETCYVIVGENGVGSLNEDSLVYAGASFRAGIQQNFNLDVRENIGGSKLHLVENLKDIPVDATVYQFYSKDGVFLMTDTEERTGGAAFLKRKVDEMMELSKIQEALGNFGIKFDTVEALTSGLQQLSTKAAEAESYKASVAKLEQDLSAAKSEVDVFKNQLAHKDETIAELIKENERLAKDSELAKAYKDELLEKALKLGVQANGNAFNKDVHQRLFSAMTVDELKEIVNAFEEQVKTKFSGAAVVGQERKPVTSRHSNSEPTSVNDFEDENEFRSYVGEKALKLYKAQDANSANFKSLTEITKELMHQFLKESE